MIAHHTHQLRHLRILQLRRRPEPRRPHSRLVAVRAVQPQHVEVQVDSQVRIEPLHERHCSRPRPRHARALRLPFVGGQAG